MIEKLNIFFWMVEKFCVIHQQCEEMVLKYSDVINQREVQFTYQDVHSLRKLEITRKR